MVQPSVRCPLSSYSPRRGKCFSPNSRVHTCYPGPPAPINSYSTSAASGTPPSAGGLQLLAPMLSDPGYHPYGHTHLWPPWEVWVLRPQPQVLEVEVTAIDEEGCPELGWASYGILEWVLGLSSRLGLNSTFGVNNNSGWVGIMAVAVSLSHIFINL